MLKNMPDQDPSQLYSNLAEYYRNTQKDYATALDYCEKPEERQNRTEHSPTMIEKCLILFRQGRIDEFNDCYKEAITNGRPLQALCQRFPISPSARTYWTNGMSGPMPTLTNCPRKACNNMLTFTNTPKTIPMPSNI